MILFLDRNNAVVAKTECPASVSVQPKITDNSSLRVGRRYVVVWCVATDQCGNCRQHKGMRDRLFQSSAKPNFSLFDLISHWYGIAFGRFGRAAVAMQFSCFELD